MIFFISIIVMFAVLAKHIKMLRKSKVEKSLISKFLKLEKGFTAYSYIFNIARKLFLATIAVASTKSSLPGYVGFLMTNYIFFMANIVYKP